MKDNVTYVFKGTLDYEIHWKEATSEIDINIKSEGLKAQRDAIVGMMATIQHLVREVQDIKNQLTWDENRMIAYQNSILVIQEQLAKLAPKALEAKHNGDVGLLKEEE